MRTGVAILYVKPPLKMYFFITPIFILKIYNLQFKFIDFGNGILLLNINLLYYVNVTITGLKNAYYNYICIFS